MLLRLVSQKDTKALSEVKQRCWKHASLRLHMDGGKLTISLRCPIHLKALTQAVNHPHTDSSQI